MKERSLREEIANRRDLYCAECGYGIAARREPPACPMCRAHAWVPRRRGETRSAPALAAAA